MAVPEIMNGRLKADAGHLLVAPVGSVEPVDLVTAWSNSWVNVGPTIGGHAFSLDSGRVVQHVMERTGAIGTTQGEVDSTVSFATPSVTAQNLALTMAGVVAGAGAGAKSFSPTAGSKAVMLGWESLDGTERWIFRVCEQTGTVEVVRNKEDVATIPMTFIMLSPSNGRAPWKSIITA